MKKLELNKDDSEVYMEIVKSGNMDDMFDFGYVVGRAKLAREQLEEFKLKNPDLVA